MVPLASLVAVKDFAALFLESSRDLFPTEFLEVWEMLPDICWPPCITWDYSRLASGVRPWGIGVNGAAASDFCCLDAGPREYAGASLNLVWVRTPSGAYDGYIYIDLFGTLNALASILLSSY